MKPKRKRVPAKPPLYFIFKWVDNDWKFQFRMYQKSPNYVRMYLAENGYEGSYRWKSANGKIWHGTSLVR
jgi:hypothetical protein